MAKIAMNNGTDIVLEINRWSETEPAEICVYLERGGNIVQDIVIVRESKKQDGVEVLVYADEYDEDYTNKFEIKEYKED